MQALNIPTKINRGTVEIVSDVSLITAGDKVGASEATLLAKLGIKPFSYGLVIQKVWDELWPCLVKGHELSSPGHDSTQPTSLAGL